VSFKPMKRQAFGPFWLEKMLGRGGMSEVFLATRRDQSGPPVVLKRLRPELMSDAEYLHRLRFEATVAARLRHPNLVQLLEFGRVGECYYLAMEHVRGYSLRRLIDHAMELDKPPPTPVALGIATGILGGLTAMHGATDDDGHPRPILHRDVTPGNVIIDHQGRAVLIDFGIAKDVFGPSITRVGRIVGTARYMSPEHRMGQFVDPRADVFSASIILFELLTARHPWPPMSARMELLRTVFDPPEIPPEIVQRIPADLLAAVTRGLENDQERRYRDAAAMLAALEAESSVRAMRQAGASLVEETLAWVRKSGIPSDESLNDMVIDSQSSKPEAEGSVVWNPKGQLTAENHFVEEAPRTSDLPEAKRVTIPPLAPRIEIDKTADLAVEALGGPPRSHDFRKPAIALLVVIAIVLGVLLVRATT
jgi:eukaryotic-like serine/threonine-protein kinase